MRPKIRCDGESTVLLQNFLDLNRAQTEATEGGQVPRVCLDGCKVCVKFL
jgi:hypothetical protein